jgi:hypothetical protein
MEVWEDTSSGSDLTSIDFGVAAERGPSSPKLNHSPTSLLIDPYMLDDEAVLAAARRERRALPARVARVGRVVTSAVSTLWSRIQRLVRGRVLEPVARRRPTPIERAESAQTVVRAPPPRKRSSQWDVATEVVRERSFPGLVVHDLELDD